MTNELSWDFVEAWLELWKFKADIFQRVTYTICFIFLNVLPILSRYN